MGFDFSAGRLDEVVHPFCTTVGPGDVRITTRFERANFAQAFFGILHEAGHGLYEQGLKREHYGTPMGEAVSLAIHESQSRLWENFVGRSGPFWQHFLPRVQGIFPSQLGSTSLDAFVRAINVVRPSLIRTEADEVTYNLHIIMRFELGRGLIEDAIKVSELPQVWNAKVQEYLGLTPPSAKSGVLQDPHWAMGLFGYFPTYTLGNVYAAQLWDALRTDLPVDGLLAAGQLIPIVDWLRTHVYQHGSVYQPVELIERAAGKPPSPDYLIDYLQSKYGRLYGLDGQPRRERRVA